MEKPICYWASLTQIILPAEQLKRLIKFLNLKMASALCFTFLAVILAAFVFNAQGLLILAS